MRALSSGLRRRVALARAMLREPRVLLLDEAFSGLDQDSTKRLEDYLHAFKAAGGTAVVVTHSLGRALAIADRVAILAGGPHRGRGDPREPHRGGAPAPVPRRHGRGRVSAGARE